MPASGILQWCDERVLRLRELLGKGFSYGMIASELGTTRNAICGKVSRMGLAETKPRPAVKVEQKRPPRPSRPFNGGRVSTAVVVERTPPRSEPEVYGPPGPAKTFFELTESECRWPLGGLYDPAVYFCAAPRVVGAHPYCTLHMRMSYTRSSR